MSERDWEPDESQIKTIEESLKESRAKNKKPSKLRVIWRYIWLELRYRFWKLRSIHRHKWITREEPNIVNKNEMIEMERMCSACLKHQTNILGDWVTTELSYEEWLDEREIS